ncbi:interleukin-7 receptor subunit alpha isoform X1 [Sinocyclocheilus anshuiensis]|uniref:Interleukin-7 receptor subunit alpha-like n=1 Tax=Sinocyclocheilus anshuiensis TaxID=1608454 RepID=A0A671LKY4_9TELE|nr:PREDICTED: interleukin-7 receptor subunit alpha-like isoform X1 [Sinocyclocheilus anshuiensis]
MAGVLWMLLVVFCPLVLSESGDDDGSDKDVTCTSTLTLNQSNLTCSLSDESTEEVIFTRLCKMEGLKKVCTNSTSGPRDITFKNLIVSAKYVLRIGDEVFENIDLSKIVKIPAPVIKLATYMEDTEEVFIWFEHSHEYVINPKFELEIWGDKLDKPISPTIKYRNFSISRDRLGGDGVYYTCVRAKPVEFFDGNWSEWSSNASFTIKSSTITTTEKNFDLPKVGYIITFFVVLVLIIGLGTLRWRTHIKDYITPNIPHPKATLAQMHRGLPFTFSPEIFSDVFIHRVDYVDEKPSAPEPQDGLDEHRYSQASSSSTSVSEMDMKADEWLPRDQSHLKIRLLDEPDLLKERENGSSQSTTAPRRECKDEAYVTMSSLFKTQ